MAAEKIHGKLSSFEFNGSELCFQDGSSSEDWTIRDATDSCTSGDGEETVLGRKTEAFEISGYLKDGSGNRISCKTLNFDFDSVKYYAKDISLEESGNETDATDGETGGSGTETVVGFVSRKSTMQFLMKDTVASPVRNSTKAAVLNFSAGVTVTGNLRLESYGDNVPVKDMVGITVNGTWQGGITKAGLGSLNVNDTGTAKMIYKTGAVSNKERTGNVVLTAIKFSGNYDDDLKVTYSFKVNGGLSENQYAAV